MENEKQLKIIVLASHNKGKAREYEALLSPFGFRVMTADSFGIDMEKAKETSDTFEGNSLIKATYAYKSLGGAYPVLSDDSGICFWGLGGFPGVTSARWEPDGHSEYSYKNQKIIEMLKDNPDRTCSFFCAITYIDEKGTHRFQGKSDGIVPERPGEKPGMGFGYDPIFFSPELGKTYGEATLDEKDAVSHRGRATRLFLEYIEKNADQSAR